MASPATSLEALKRRLTEISDLNAAAALLHWDQATYMPPRGITARARQGALLGRVAHERAVDPRSAASSASLPPMPTASPPMPTTLA